MRKQKSVGIIVKGGDGKPERVIEKHIINENNKKELIFMSEERKEELMNKNKLKEYVEQFDKIPKELNGLCN